MASLHVIHHQHQIAHQLEKTSSPVYGCVSELPIPTVGFVVQSYMSIKSKHSKTTLTSETIKNVDLRLSSIFGLRWNSHYHVKIHEA